MSDISFEILDIVNSLKLTFFANSFKVISIFFNDIQKYVTAAAILCGLDLFIFVDLFFILL